MIRIDGSMHSGSGTLLRYAAVLSTLMREPLHMFRIRAKRGKPGLRPQHLQALRACCSLSDGRLEGDAVNSQEVLYTPGKSLKGGDFRWDIGTAGSATMLAFTVIPAALYADAPSRFSITGGLFQDFAPSAFHMQKVLIPVIRRMGADVELEILRPGYVPRGGGELVVHVRPVTCPLESLRMLNQGSVRRVRGIALSSHLEEERVSERMADRSRVMLEGLGFQADIQLLRDDSAIQKGAAMLIWAETDTAILGADQAGKRGRRSEDIARFVVNSLMEDMGTGATTDCHLADQLILFAALARDRTEYLIPRVTEHVESNLWLVSEIIGARSELQANLLRIYGIGFYPYKA